MKKVYSPGCALLIDKPGLARKISDTLNRSGYVPDHLLCCRRDTGLDKERRSSIPAWGATADSESWIRG